MTDWNQAVLVAETFHSPSSWPSAATHGTSGMSLDDSFLLAEMFGFLVVVTASGFVSKLDAVFAQILSWLSRLSCL